MKAVCAAAKSAAESEQSWITRLSTQIIGVSGRQNRKLVPFHVTFGGGTYRYYLSAGAVLFSKTSEGFIAIDLATFDKSQLETIERALRQLANQPVHT